MYKHLFVPVDGSDLSHRAMDGSIELAQQLGARITGFVVEPDLPITAAARGEQLLDRMKENETRNEAHATALLGQFQKRAEAAGVGREPSEAPAMIITAPDREPVSPRRLGVAETLESPGPLPLPVLPFAPAPAPRADSPDATLELGAVLPIAPLPFRRNNQ